MEIIRGGGPDGRRTVTVKRDTRETRITLTLNLDGAGTASVDTGIGFFDHMPEGFARHGFFDLEVKVDGDLKVDCHHTVEDTGIVLGCAIREALGDRRTTRIDTLVTAIVENSGDDIRMDPGTEIYFQQLHTFMFEALYRNPVAKSEESKVDGLVSRMFDYYIHNPGQLPDEFAAIREAEGAPRAVCDYIAGMTDNYALEIYHTLFIPRSWSIQLK